MLHWNGLGFFFGGGGNFCWARFHVYALLISYVMNPANIPCKIYLNKNLLNKHSKGYFLLFVQIDL